MAKRFRDTKTGEFVTRLFARRKPKSRTVAETVDPMDGNTAGRGRTMTINDLPGVNTTAQTLASECVHALAAATVPGSEHYPLRSGEAEARADYVTRGGALVAVTVRVYAPRKPGGE